MDGPCVRRARAPPGKTPARDGRCGRAYCQRPHRSFNRLSTEQLWGPVSELVANSSVMFTRSSGRVGDVRLSPQHAAKV